MSLLDLVMRHFRVLLPPVLVSVAGSWLLMQIVSPDLNIPIPLPPKDLFLPAEATSRFSAASALLLQIMASVAAVFLAYRVLWRRVAVTKRIAACFVVGGVGVVAGVATFGGPRLYTFLGKDLFEQTLGSYPVANTHLGLLDSMINIGNLCAATAGTLLVVAVSYLLPPPPSKPARQSAPDIKAAMDRDVGELAGRVHDLKLMLFAAAAVLFTGVVFMKAWRDWPLAFWPETGDAAGREAYRVLAAATVNYQAFHCVLILAAIFIPVAMALRDAGQRLAAQDPSVGADPAARDRWLASAGVSLSISEQAQRLFAIVTPYLAPAAASVLSQSAKVFEFLN